MDDFSKYFEESLNGLVLEFKPGEKVQGVVCSIDNKNVFVDIKSVSEGIINREEFLDKEGELTVKVGDEIEAFFVSNHGDGINLSVKMTGQSVSDHLDEAFSSGIPVEGKVAAERKGGYTVKLAGRDAFCPYSQMSLTGGDPEEFIGNQYSFNITELNSHNIVVTRRRILEQEREVQLEKFKQSLEVGDELEGKVVNIKDFGVFVDLGCVQGFIPASELAWARNIKANDLFQIGDTVKVSVHQLDWERNRITLSFRSANTPWSAISGKYGVGSHCTAKITRLEHYGAFAELEPGLEGLIHISNFGTGGRIKHPREVVEVGEMVDVEVDRIDEESHKISLKRTMVGGAPAEVEAEAKVAVPGEPVKAGEVVTGTVDGIKPFGVFVRLNAEQSGLLHVSEADLPEFSQNTFKALSDKYPIGSDITVFVKEINGRKISLASKEKMDRAKEEAKTKGDRRDRGSNNFGSLGDLFGDL